MYVCMYVCKHYHNTIKYFPWQSESDRISHRVSKMMCRDSGKIAQALRLGVSNVRGSVLCATIHFHELE